MIDQPCPCESGVAHAACCGRYLDGGIAPATVAELMRSRYTAYVLGREDHLLRTWHPSTRPRALRLADEPVTWLGLKVLRACEDGDEGVVEFVARYKVNGKGARLRESSRFVREGGRWLYVDGKTTDGNHEAP